MVITINCPTCSKQVTWSAKAQWRPFCSERCKLIDLGEWANESHRIVGDKINMEAFDDENEITK